MPIHSHLPYDHSTSHARVPAGGIHLIASIDSISEAQGTVSFFGSTKALHGEVAIPSAETTTHNHSNQQYSITAVTTSAGAVAERYAYSAYGEPTICDGSGSAIGSSAINNRYSYTGREWDGTVGLYHFRARWMSPQSGRFLSRDPIGYKGSEWGLYQFLDGMPLEKKDPSGLIPIQCTCLKYPPFSGGLAPVQPSEYTVSTNCSGLGESCCRDACNPNGFSGNWKVVEGPDAYDEAAEDFEDAMCDIQFCCMPVPGGAIVGAASRTCWRAAIVFSRHNHALVRIVSPSGRVFWRHMPGQSRVGKAMCQKGAEYYVDDVSDIRWWSHLFPEIPISNPLGTSSTICSPNCVWTAIRGIANGL